ncbi:hypothetical protein HMI54_010506 [Coelomomyces lativittatus]|nr:hypothetical protein HMI54_010506 [Coelomomyces lativittatus]KAJ1514740.1 hypothetical protein HMI55_004411 [Coelomomyces lativittatus]
MTQCLLDTLLTQQSKTPQLAQSCTTRDCMSCQQEFSVTTRIVHGKPVPKLIRRYHRMFINPLNEHRYVLICYHCVQRLKKLRTYCTYCLHIPDRSLLRVAAKKKTNKENHATDLCDRCEFPYTQVENEDPVLRSAKPYQVQKTDVLDLKELGIR